MKEPEVSHEPRTNLRGVAVPLVLAALTAYWGFVNFHRPVSSPRPMEDIKPEVALVGDQFVPARLWQDPFDVVRAEAASDDNRTTPEFLQRSITTRTKGATKPNVKVLAVMVEGNAYPEDKEVRRRLRYALQQALAAMQYAPDDRNNVGVLNLTWPSEPSDFTFASYLAHLDCGLPGLKRSRKFPSTLTVPAAFSQISELVSNGAYLAPVLPILSTNGSLALRVTMPPEPESVLHVPFEWFDSTSTNAPVLVLWLAEEQFADFPIQRLGLLLDNVFVQTHKQVHSITILGPRSSNTLALMADPRMPGGSTDNFGFFLTNQLGLVLNKLAVYTCQATVPDYVLLNTNSFEHSNVDLNRARRRPILGKQFDQFTGGQSQRLMVADSIELDDTLAHLLVDELANRQLYLAPPTNETNHASMSVAVDQVVLLYESDTLYGRSLAQLMSAALREKYLGTNFSAALELERSSPPLGHISRIPYLRGLDGTKAGGTSELEDEAASSRKRLSTFEKAEGDHQVDYLKRIANALYTTNRKLVSTGKASPIKAIGILGSDVYDKLILLQVLRSKFPNAVFFTTDLDDRLLHRDEQDWTRNLIVASSFPLKASDDSSLIFRDSYQTALFRACRAAVAGRLPYLPPAGIYEIGRTKPISLRSEPLGATTLPTANFLVRGFRVHRQGFYWWAGLGIAISLLSLTLLFRNSAWAFYTWIGAAANPDNMVRRSRRLVDLLKAEYGTLGADGRRNEMEKAQRKKRKLVFFVSFITVCCLAFFVVKIWQFHDYPQEEPFAWWEGTSVWPTEILRVITIIFCFGSVIWAYETYHARLYEVFEKYHLRMAILSRRHVRDLDESASNHPPKGGRTTKIPTEESRAIGLLGHVRRCCATVKHRYACWSINQWPSSANGVDALELFTEYQERGLLHARFKRVFLFMFVFLIFGISLCALFGFPNSPVRGVVSASIDRLLLALTVIMFVLLIAYVVDITRLTERLLRRLGDGVTIWPNTLLDEYEKDIGLPKQFLSGVIDVEFVATHTRNVNVAAYLPFCAIALMLLSRSSYFDRWLWPLGLTIILAAYFMIAIGCAYAIRHRAQKVRDQAVEQLERCRIAVATPPAAHKIELALAHIESKKIGAYSGWWQDPTIVGMLIPPSGAGALALIKSLITG